jgi:gamma-glutamylcyclotransferase (GGCT)/AIG2-like uncharacterized protein YtfP
LLRLSFEIGVTGQVLGGMPLFAYGTLMFAPVIRSVIGRVPECCPAAVDGYRRLQVVGELFPGLVRESGGGKVEGILYSDIHPFEWERLTSFEDDFYELEQVAVVCPQGERVALAYLVPSSRRSVLSENPWSVELFRQQYLSRFPLNASAPRSD